MLHEIEKIVGKVRTLLVDEQLKNMGRLPSNAYFLNADEVVELKQSGTYDVWKYYNNHADIRAVLDRLNFNPFCDNTQEFRGIFDELMYRNDEYLLLADFHSYLDAQERVENRYADKAGWARMCLINIAKSGYFSSDRTIEQYAQEIWRLSKIDC